MSKSYNGEIEFPYAYNIETQKPLDCRSVVDSVSDLTNTLGTFVYVGMLVYVKSEGKYYSYKETSTNVFQWVELATGGGSGTISSVKIGATTYNPTNGVVTLALKDGDVDFGGSDRDAYGYGAKMGLSPCDTLFSETGGNRFAFYPASLITIEYSRDGGSTWSSAGASDSAKTALFTLNAGVSFAIGLADSTNKATTSANYNKYMLRVTINTNGSTCYARFWKFILNVSTNGSSGCYCDLQGALQGSPTTFTAIKSNIPLSGWSGYNVINLDNPITTYGNRSDQYQYLRWVFKTTAVGNTSYNGLTIMSIKGFADTAWNTPSTMGVTGHLYSYDADGNASFPKKISASCLNLTGGRTNGSSGDDEGLVIGFANNNYAGMCLGNPTGLRSVFYLNSSNLKATWRYNNGTTTYDIEHPQKAGTIALTSDIPSSLPANGGTASNVSGVVAIANGGTGASTRLNALKNLTSENVSTAAQWFLTITDNWGKGGYTSVADAKSVLGLKSAAYTESSAYATAGHTHSYLPLSGGAMSGRITRAGGGRWIDGRANAVVFGSASTSGRWNTIWSQKTKDGAWTAGNLGSDNVLRFVYDTDANYNASNNTQTYEVLFQSKSGTIALTSDIPTIPSSLPASDVYAWAKASTKPSYSASEVGAIEAYRGASRSTATAGYWAAMCNTTQTGSPKLPTSGKWWHVLSMDWTGNDTNNWISQLALPTQDDNSVYYRKNAVGTSIDSASWIKLLDSSNYTDYCATASHTHSNYLTSVPAASSSTRGGAKIYASGDILYISTQ